jgi:hypothetical protein
VKNPDVNYENVLGNILDTTLHMCKKEIKDSWFFTHQLKADLAAFVYARAMERIDRVSMEEIDKLSLEKYLLTEKGTLQTDFREDCRSADQDSRTGCLIVEKIITEVLKMRIQEQVGHTLFEAYLTKHYLFRHKKDLLFYSHKDLLEATTTEVIQFSRNFPSHLKEWIQKHIIDFCHRDDTLRGIFEKQWESEINEIKNIVATTDTSADPKAWFEDLMKEFQKGTFAEVKYQVANMKERIRDDSKIAVISDNIQDTLEDKNLFDKTFPNVAHRGTHNTQARMQIVLESLTFNPVTEMYKQRVGCTGQCPFCGSVCTRGIECQTDHTRHIAELHRPQVKQINN